MDQSWRQLLAVALVLTFLKSVICLPLDQDDDQIMGLGDTYDFSDEPETLDNLKKRLSSFVRIGRGLSSFIRIGKSYPIEDLMEETDDTDTGSDAMDKRKSAFVRIGKDGDYEEPEKRLSSFVRIGRDMEDFPMEEKRGGAFIRMGKFPSSAYMRRRGGIMRNIVPNGYYRRTGRIGHSSFIRIGKRDTSDALKQMQSDQDRYSRYIRIGKELENGVDQSGQNGYPLDQLNGEDIKRLSSFVRIGRNQDLLTPAQFSQLGAEPNSSEKRRYSSFVRIGKSKNDKRLSKFVRIGKSGPQDKQEPIEIITDSGSDLNSDKE